ncbi:MAG: carbohydrate-binding family 9-like protein, partial [Victivallaceae bacterium]
MNKILITMLCIVSLTAVSAPVELRIGRAAKIKPGSNWESVCRELLKSGDKERQFLLTGTSPIRKQTTDNYLADDQTEFAAAEDGRNLYLAVRCYDSRGRNLTARCVEHDGPVWKDDDIEIFIAPRYRGKDYYQFIVNPLGTMYEGRCQDREWGCDWKAKVVRGTDAWTIFCMIPLRAVGIKSDSGFIGFNIYRSRCAGDGSEFSSWSYLSGGPHNTGEFGILVLGEAGKGLG